MMSAIARPSARTMLTASFGPITWRRVASTLDTASCTTTATVTTLQSVVDPEITIVLMTSSSELSLSQSQDQDLTERSATVKMVEILQILMSAVLIIPVWTSSTQTVGVVKKIWDIMKELILPAIARPSAKTTMDVIISPTTLRDLRAGVSVTFTEPAISRNVTGKSIVLLGQHILTWMTAVKHLNFRYENVC